VSHRRGRSVDILGLDHVQIAAPEGCEPDARRFFGELLGLNDIEKLTWDEELAGVRRFFTHDPWGNRLELLA